MRILLAVGLLLAGLSALQPMKQADDAPAATQSASSSALSAFPGSGMTATTPVPDEGLRCMDIARPARVVSSHDPSQQETLLAASNRASVGLT